MQLLAVTGLTRLHEYEIAGTITDSDDIIQCSHRELRRQGATKCHSKAPAIGVIKEVKVRWQQGHTSVLWMCSLRISEAEAGQKIPSSGQCWDGCHRNVDSVITETYHKRGFRRRHWRWI